jgi:hypothetical protein
MAVPVLPGRKGILKNQLIISFLILKVQKAVKELLSIIRNIFLKPNRM